MADDADTITVYVCDLCWWEGLPEVDAQRFPYCGHCGSFNIHREEREVPDGD